MVCCSRLESTKNALEYTVKLASAFQSDVIAVTVLKGVPQEKANDPEYSKAVLEQAKNTLKNAEAFFKENNQRCETKMLPPNNLSIGENLVKFAEDEQIDQIVIGMGKKSKVSKLIFGSNAQHVLLSARCPVTLVK